MAQRPVFIPDFSGQKLFQQQVIEFKWANGFAEIQKKKSIASLHDAAKKKGLKNILEISSKSDEEIGRRLSAFNLKYQINEKAFSLESVYQGSKVFENDGPFTQIFSHKPREAKKFVKNLNSGNLKEYNLQGFAYPLSPPNAFYDWLYIRSLADHAEWIQQNVQFEAFTDIEFNPEKQINCQARAFAVFLSLLKKGELSKASTEFNYFCSMLCDV